MTKLANPPVYFPIERGRYELGPGLKALGTDFGNGALDKNIFQISKDFSRFRQNKIQSRLERVTKYVQQKNLSQHADIAVCQIILKELTEKYPTYFILTEKNEIKSLTCLLSEDEIGFNSKYELLSFSTKESWENDRADIRPKNLLDALLLQIQEDIAILEKQGDQDWISYLHLSSPSHWAAEDKIGLNFSAVHQPIPGIDLVVKAAANLTDAMIHKGPFVRFVWSFVTDERLNHHPIPPPGKDPAEWRGRSFNINNAEAFFLRIERQTTWGFPECSASLFTIGLSFIPASKIKANPTWKSQLISALQSMTPESKRYKGVDLCFDDLISYLEN